MVEAINTQTFFSASLPAVKQSNPESAGPAGPVLLTGGAILLLLAGIGIWLVLSRGVGKTNPKRRGQDGQTVLGEQGHAQNNIL